MVVHPVLTFGECGHVDDPGVVGLELLEQLLRGHVPDKDVLPHTRYGSVLTLHSEEMAEYCTLYYIYVFVSKYMYFWNKFGTKSISQIVFVIVFKTTF